MQKDIQMGLRLKPDFHKKCAELANNAGQSLAEWIRRAMKEKADRDSHDFTTYVKDDLIKALDNPEYVQKLIEKIEETKFKYK